MVAVGGRRTRMIVDAFHNMVTDGLDQLGWFNPTIYDVPAGTRKHQKVTVVVRPDDWEDKVDFNSIAITCEDVIDDPAEMGSNLTDDTWSFSIDVYAENDSVGMHLINDIRDILRGKMPSIGRSRPNLPVIDPALPGDPVVFHCEIDRVIVDRARGFTKAWQQHWWACRCDVIDTYGDEDYG